MWNGKRFVTPEDIQWLKRCEADARYMEDCAKRCDEIRPQVEKLWEEVQKWMRKGGK